MKSISKSQTGLEYVVIIGGIIIFSAASYFIIKSFSETSSGGTNGEMRSVFDIYTSELDEIAGEAGPVIFFSGPLNMNGSGIYNVSEIEVEVVNTSELTIHNELTNALIESIGGSPLIIRSALYMLVEAVGNLILNPSGNVGIKTNAPASELDVNGTVTADSAVFDGADNVTNAVKMGDGSGYVTAWNEGDGKYVGSPDSFNEETVGTTGASIAWVETLSGGADAEIVGEVGSHKNVLRLIDIAGGKYVLHAFPNGDQDAGTREFWIRTNDTSERTKMEFRRQSNLKINLRINENKFQYWNTSFSGWADTGLTAVNDTWYHCKVKWTAGDTYDWYIDGLKVVDDEPFSEAADSGIAQFYFWNYDTHTSYLDAWGDPSDPNYEEGDNWLHERIIKADSSNLVENEAYGSEWENDTGHAPSQNAVYDEMETRAKEWTWRDVGAWDFDETGLTDTSSTWNDLDLSGIVGAQESEVILKIRINDDVAGSAIQIRKKGDANAYHCARFLNQVANLDFYAPNIMLSTDSNGVVEIWSNPKPTDFNDIDIVVRAYRSID